MKALILLTEDNIKELIPMVGHRTRLISNLREWKTIVQGTADLVWMFFSTINNFNYLQLIKVSKF